MFLRRTLQWWTGLVLVCLMVSFVLFAFVARKPLCIDSKLVEKIDNVSGGKIATAYRCGLHRPVDFDAVLASHTRDLGRRLQKMERFFDWMGPLKARIGLTLISGTGTRLQIRGHEIEMSESLLQVQGQFEKAIFKVWFRERAHDSLRENPLIEESLTDLLYTSFSGVLDLQEPVSGLFLGDDKEARWPRVLATFKGTCQGIWKTTEQISLCEKPDEFSESNSQIDMLSLRPLVSQALVNAYHRLKPIEQMNLLRGISKNLGELKFDDQQFGMSSLSEKQQSFTQSAFQLESWIHSLTGISPKFSALFASDLKTRGYEGVGSVADLDTLIFSDEMSADLRQSLDSEVRLVPQNSLVGWIEKTQIQMNFESDKMELSLFGEIKAMNGLYFHCGKIEMKNLLAAAAKVEKLVYVDSCGKNPIKISGFLKKGIVSFAMQNPKTKFIEFHTPSLRSALAKLPGVNPVEAMNSSSQHVHFFKQLGWTAPTFDTGVNAYRAQSVIEAIDWYRL